VGCHPSRYQDILYADSTVSLSPTSYSALLTVALPYNVPKPVLIASEHPSLLISFESLATTLDSNIHTLDNFQSTVRDLMLGMVEGSHQSFISLLESNVTALSQGSLHDLDALWTWLTLHFFGTSFLHALATPALAATIPG